MVNLYLCCIVTAMLLLVALQYHFVLKEFHIKIMKNDLSISPIMNLDVSYKPKPRSSPGLSNIAPFETFSDPKGSSDQKGSINSGNKKSSGENLEESGHDSKGHSYTFEARNSGARKSLERKVLYPIKDKEESDFLADNKPIEVEPQLVISDRSKEDKIFLKRKYNCCHLYKITTVLFQWSFISSLLVFLLYLSFLVPQTRQKVLVNLNHIAPLAIIAVDFGFNCVPFIGRHYCVFTLGFIAYMLYYMLRHKLSFETSHMFKWSEDEMGYLVPALMIPLGLVVHILLAWLSKKKMQLNHKEDALNQLDQMYKDEKLRKALNKRSKRVISFKDSEYSSSQN